MTSRTGDLGALLLADGRLPSGSYAHSAGLEPAIRSGLTIDQVPSYLESRLRTVGLVEASAAVLAWRCATSAVTDVPADLSVELPTDLSADLTTELTAVQDALLARTPSAPMRNSSELLGRGLLRLGRRLTPEHPGVATLAGWLDPPLRPIALGVVAASLGMDERQVGRASLYDDVQTVTAAALKLLPMDPMDGTAWLLACAPVLEDVLDRALAVKGPSDLPAFAAPIVEQWSLDHEISSRRIFVA